MNKLWIFASCVAIACLAPLSCSDDETQASGPTSSRASSASTGGASNSATSSTSASSSGQGGAGGTPSCEECMGPLLGKGGTCGKQQIACNDDAECNAWLGCYADCMQNDFTTACFDACDAQYVAVASLYGPVVTCVCAPCARPCAPFCG